MNSFLPGSGLLINGLAKLFGADPTNEQDLINKISNDPDAYLKLRQFELEHQKDILALDLQDRASAREREKSVIGYTQKRDWVMDFLAIFITIAFFVLCIIVAYSSIDDKLHSIFYMLLGVFGSGFGVVMNYYFGSSVMTKMNSPPIEEKKPVILPIPRDT